MGCQYHSLSTLDNYGYPIRCIYGLIGVKNGRVVDLTIPDSMPAFIIEDTSVPFITDGVFLGVQWGDRAAYGRKLNKKELEELAKAIKEYIK